jgi:hypothetical protein
LAVISPLASASVRAGSPCTKAGVISIVSGYKYTCVKSGKKLLWSKGVKVVVAKPKTPPTQTPTAPPATITKVQWQYDFNNATWVSQGVVPKCPTPLISTSELTDFSKIVSIVQPGQSRGGSYKPHGGLRWSTFGTYVKGVTITAPFDGEIVGAVHYTVSGIYQFGINIIHPCGVMLRMGHLQEPSEYIKAVLKGLPAAAENDSRESFLQEFFIKKGQIIATEVGMPLPALPDSLGTYMDLGILNLLTKNPALSASFVSNADVKYSLYSVCWYEGNYFSDVDKARLLSLPLANGDATSDYCKQR